MSKKFKVINFNGHTFSEKENNMTVSKNGKSVSFHIPKGVSFEILNNTISFHGENKSYVGTAESLCFNAIKGLDIPHEKKLKVVGIGYKVALKGKILSLILGFSHNIEIEIPGEVTLEVPNPTNMVFKSANASALGDIVAKIEKLKKYNVYTGTGVINLAKEAAGLLIRKEVKRK